MLNTVLLLIFPAFMAFAAASDLFTMRISNKLVLGLVCLFAPVALVAQLPWSLIGWNFLAAFCVLAVTFAFFAFGWIGGGDAKFAAAVALWLGGLDLLVFLLTAATWGAGLTLVILAFRRFPLPPRLAVTPWVVRLHHPKTGVPYGIALAAAGLMTYSQSPLFAALAG